jgi:EmrB/QacA subfamily drug resistance transporter
MSQPRYPAGIIGASILGTSLAFIDGSVVTVALPSIGRDLHANAAELAWTVNAYALPLGALILLGGAAGDHYGRRKLFQIGIVLFLLASLLCSAAPTLDLLLAGRGLQGIGAALLMPNSLATLGASFAGEERGRAIGTWAAVGAIAGVVGPVIGGWIVDVSGWRLIFLVNLPIGLAAMALAWRYVPESRDHGRAGGLDWWGGITATIGLGALVWALTAAAEPHIPRASIHAAVAGGAALLALFLWIEWRRGEAALMPFTLFGTATFAGLTLMTFFLYAALGGLMVLLPFLLIRLGGYSGVQAGAALLPVPLLIAIGSRLMGRVAARLGGRLPLAAGSAITAIGLALYRRIEVGGIDYMRDILPPTLAIALGMAICVAPLTTTVMNSVDADHVGAASGFNSAMARIGGLIATALLGFVFASAGSEAVFVASIHVAATVAAAAAAFAALCALLLIRSTKGETP